MTQIKSEKANAYLNPQNITHFELFSMDKDTCFGICIVDAEEAVIIAEAEAHDRAVEAFKNACSCGRSDSGGIGGKCRKFTDCERFKCFVSELNK